MSHLSDLIEASAQQSQTETTVTSRNARNAIVTIAIIALFALTVVAFLIARGIIKPLGQTVKVLEAMATGDFTQRLDINTTDEIGQMATALNQAVEGMNSALQEVSTAANHAVTVAQQLSAASEQLSSGAQEQASSLEETAASLEEFTSTIKQTADNAKQANQLAVGSRDMADKGGRVVTNAVTAMGEINRSSRKIADIITAIDEIAFQTNLLALNAAVEAARAGEQGRGFAVVATEVRNLAQRSAGAAKEIKGLIQDSVQKVQTGSELVNQSGQTLDEIVGSVKRVTDIIAEITAASQEQSLGIDQVNKAVGQMDQVTQATAAQTEELSSTAQSLSAQAQQLQALVGRFKLAQSGLTTTPSVGVYGGVTPPSTPALSKVRMKKAAPVPVSAPAGGANGSTHELADGFEEF
jgi:methyl-accepting chemotaxis protein